MSGSYPDDMTQAEFNRLNLDERDQDREDEDGYDDPVVGIDVCHHGVGFDEACEDCNEEMEGEE